MEEVEILPRDAYLHTVNIAQVPCTLQWWFTTKRKNIDFGLFHRKNTEETASLAGSMVEGSSTIGRQRGLGHFKLQDRGAVELMALKHYESSKSTIKGSWKVTESGTYVLYFDNSFSKNTSKRVSFCVAVKEEAREEPRVDFSGWLLKKKRKRMQGWARRWFAVQGAWLVYSTTEGGVPRAKIDVAGAVVSTSKEDRSITIDADEGFFQLRAQSQNEYEGWVQALKSAKEHAASGHSAGATLQQEQGSRADVSGAKEAHAEFEESMDKLARLLGGLGDPALREAAFQYLHAASASESTLHGMVGAGPAYASSAADMGHPVALSPSRASWFSDSDVFYDTNEILELSNGDEAGANRSPDMARVVDDDEASDEDDGYSDPGSREGTDSSGRSSRLREDLIRDPDFIEALARNSIQIGNTDSDKESSSKAEGDSEGAGEGDDATSDPRPSATVEGTRRLLAGYEPRTRLPAETCAANVSLISILRKNVGKDL
ncbi:Oxysterol-binding protein 3, partial [Coemansia erecta]